MERRPPRDGGAKRGVDAVDWFGGHPPEDAAEGSGKRFTPPCARLSCSHATGDRQFVTLDSVRRTTVVIGKCGCGHHWEEAGEIPVRLSKRDLPPETIITAEKRFECPRLCEHRWSPNTPMLRA
jgi:hypothetical protein